MKKAIFTILLFASLNAFATQQIDEVLDLGGARFDIDETPLESHPNYKKIVQKVGSGMCSAAWRGYKGIWTIRNKKLFLDFVVKDPCGNDSEYLHAAELFEIEDSKVVADWYTGNITFRISEVEYFDVKFSGVHGQKYEAVVYEVRSGEVISRSVEYVEHIWQ